ncbi:putative vacuolar segregation protein [Rhizodiscina lignyota]|uniref:non-reducing end alpha-L-arabinofuranosidase n=1 Tax=Rhizodiscina lignyota TaxID=1504668 RepID=A0A9P4IP45_9PEZI|nr:putative vacuolar segregation protein [Rhizodiscina lignyota]
MKVFHLSVVSAFASISNALSISVASSGGNQTSGKQYGIMFEDINHSGDGGIYAELIRNRAFQGSPVFPSMLDPWASVNGAALSLKNLSDALSSALPTSLHVAVGNGSDGPIGFANPGWWGIDVKEQKYTGSFYVKGDYKGTFTASLQSYLTNEAYGGVNIESKAKSSEWVQHEFTIVPSNAPNINNTFSITFDPDGVKGGSLDFNLISLFPPTYKNRPNGMRVDLMELLAGLKPSFLRLPGGNNLEGNDPPYYWRWNETIGPLEDRPGRPGTWGYENTDGLGLIEYMNWCDDLGMEPILAVWAGYYLDGTALSNASVQYYVQDALHELEFLMGSVDSEYGSLRAKLGYPKPWNIKYVEVGNEDNLGQGGSSYQSYRFDDFYYAIHAKYPDILVIPSTVAYESTLPGASTGDYHQYTRPDYFVSQFNFFDHYPQNRTALIGEYAAVQPNIAAGGGVNWDDPRWKFPYWIGTIGEAVFLIGAERNADKILGAAYAPLFQNLNSYEWGPDLISYTADPAQDVKSTSYHMIQLLSSHRIAETLPATSDSGYGPVYWVAGKNDDSHIFKGAVYNSTEAYNSSAPVPVSVSFSGVSAGASGALTVLTAPAPYTHNDIGVNVVKTTTTHVSAGKDGAFSFHLPDYSVAVLEVRG